MIDVLDYVPLAAAGFAVPQFLPQLLKLRATQDTAGVSWSWAALTSVNNAAWFGYFALARYWTALVPSSSATLLAGTLAVMLTRRGQAARRALILACAWAAALITSCAAAGRAGLGALLTAAFLLQVTPSIRTAYRAARPTGVSPGTWLLILGELSCWLVFGLHKADPRLIALGTSGVVASALMLARVHRAGRSGTPRPPDRGPRPGTATITTTSPGSAPPPPHGPRLISTPHDQLGGRPDFSGAWMGRHARGRHRPPRRHAATALAGHLGSYRGMARPGRLARRRLGAGGRRDRGGHAPRGGHAREHAAAR